MVRLTPLLMPILPALAAVAPALAQSAVPQPPYYALPPVEPAVPQAMGPVQQQILENYRTQLLQAQREGLRQNPSGVGSNQLEINRRLDSGTYNPALNPALPSGASPASPSLGAVPAPPFNAAPLPPSR